MATSLHLVSPTRIPWQPCTDEKIFLGKQNSYFWMKFQPIMMIVRKNDYKTNIIGIQHLFQIALLRYPYYLILKELLL
jgi:hypothetical protein